ncbi:MAG: hypothetical protein J5I90_15695 [Caldilineales bacterium]|nr:hypothetical protein [Caldilineales bacterium]
MKKIGMSDEPFTFADVSQVTRAKQGLFLVAKLIGVLFAQLVLILTLSACGASPPPPAPTEVVTGTPDPTATPEPGCPAPGTSSGGAWLSSLVAGDALGTWQEVNPMNSYRDLHTATLLPEGRVLVTGGQAEAGSESTEIYHVEDGIWNFGPPMNESRYWHTATLLINGLVLVTGGIGADGNGLASAELYDPQTDEWRMTESMHVARVGHSAVLLADGTVLVVGDGSKSTELYDPETESWIMIEDLSTSRYEPSVTLLDDGWVLVAGGSTVVGGTETFLSSAELYNPEEGSWTLTGAMVTARREHAATVLPDGRVLVTGGTNRNDGQGQLDSTELYDPKTKLWSSADSMKVHRLGHTALRLPDGKVLVAGGLTNCCVVDSAELYDPATGQWGDTDPMLIGTWGQTTTLLPNLYVLVAGGDDSNRYITAQAQVYKAEFDSFQYVRDDLIEHVNDPDHYCDLANTHKTEIREMIEDDLSLLGVGLRVAQVGWPLLVDYAKVALFQSAGSVFNLNRPAGDVVITAEQMEILKLFLRLIKDRASPGLKQDMKTEGDKLPPYEDFVGKTVAEAREIVIEGSFATATPTATPTPTVTPSPPSTPTPSPTPTLTPSPILTPTSTATPTATWTPHRHRHICTDQHTLGHVYGNAYTAGHVQAVATDDSTVAACRNWVTYTPARCTTRPSHIVSSTETRVNSSGGVAKMSSDMIAKSASIPTRIMPFSFS